MSIPSDRTRGRVALERSADERRVVGRPRARALEGGTRPQHGKILEAATDDLEADGKAVLGEAGRDGGRGLTGEVERIRERHPRPHRDGSTGDLRGMVEAQDR